MRREISSAGMFPLVLGGDHSIAAGTVAGVSHNFREQARSWPDLDRRACRHEYAGIQPQRQRARHAAWRVVSAMARES